jgi:hypothetical protein
MSFAAFKKLASELSAISPITNDELRRELIKWFRDFYSIPDFITDVNAVLFDERILETIDRYLSRRNGEGNGTIGKQ